MIEIKQMRFDSPIPLNQNILKDLGPVTKVSVSAHHSVKFQINGGENITTTNSNGIYTLDLTHVGYIQDLQFVNSETSLSPVYVDIAYYTKEPEPVQQGQKPSDTYTYYFGTSSSSTTINLQNLNSMQAPKANQSIEIDDSLNQYIVFAYPKILGQLQEIKDQNGFNITSSFTRREQGEYYTYRLIDPVSVTNFKIQFNFYAEV